MGSEQRREVGRRGVRGAGSWGVGVSWPRSRGGQNVPARRGMTRSWRTAPGLGTEQHHCGMGRFDVQRVMARWGADCDSWLISASLVSGSSWQWPAPVPSVRAGSPRHSSPGRFSAAQGAGRG